MNVTILINMEQAIADLRLPPTKAMRRPKRSGRRRSRPRAAPEAPVASPWPTQAEVISTLNRNVTRAVYNWLDTSTIAENMYGAAPVEASLMKAFWAQTGVPAAAKRKKRSRAGKRQKTSGPEFRYNKEDEVRTAHAPAHAPLDIADYQPIAAATANTHAELVARQQANSFRKSMRQLIGLRETILSKPETLVEKLRMFARALADGRAATQVRLDDYLRNPVQAFQTYNRYDPIDSEDPELLPDRYHEYLAMHLKAIDAMVYQLRHELRAAISSAYLAQRTDDQAHRRD